MDQPATPEPIPVEDVASLRRHVRDLAALLALPAMWRALDAPRIVGGLAEVVVGLLRLELAYVRVHDPAQGVTIEDAWPRREVSPSQLVEFLAVSDRASDGAWFPSAHTESPAEKARNPFGPGTINTVSIVPVGHPQQWRPVAGSSRGDFPTQQERYLLQVAVDQAALAVEKALLIAAERRAHAVAERAREEAETANRSKSAFLASMSHELRTPLNAIGGYTDLLELGVRGPMNAEQSADLQRIRRSAQHLLGLINDVLHFAKIEAGHLELAPVDIPLHQLLGRLGELVEPQLRNKGIAYEYEACSPDLVVRVDPERLRQILLNLVSNAIKFTSTGGRITLRVEAARDTVALHVCDTGCGIPPEQHALIFDPFVQGDRSFTRAVEGVGLGLAISRDLACAMGGSLSVQSAVGVGSTFTVLLPRATSRTPSVTESPAHAT